MTIEARDALVCTWADCHFKGSGETWRAAKSQNARDYG